MNAERIREIRINPIIPAESVLIATERAARLKQKPAFSPFDRRNHVADCPFCTGNEHQTPETIIQVPEHGDWRIRVVRNLYPIFGDDSSMPDLQMGLHRIIDGYGRHEVIIDHSHHGIFLGEMTISHLADLFILYRNRITALYQSNKNFMYALVFKNFGPASGGSIPHTHSQIIAMPVVPANVEMELSSSRRYYRSAGRCIFCTLIDERRTFQASYFTGNSSEMKRKINVNDYIVDQNENFVAIKPFASRFPWEIHVLPRLHSHDYQSISNDDCQHLAALLRRVMRRLTLVLGTVQYNYFIHSAPRNQDDTCGAHYHWHLEICPRTSIPNGFELASGLSINTVNPETAAEQLRKAM